MEYLKNLGTAWLFAFGLAAATGLSAPPAAAQSDDAELGPVFLVSLGGKLYDDIWTVTELPPPEGANPAYPVNANTRARDTWRCVSCHGWDYRGGAGERGAAVPGLQAPGLTGLYGTDPAQIIDRIRAPDHPFPANGLPELAVELLAAFISSGQRDIDDYAGGDRQTGQEIFEGACINCHQIDGRRYLRGEPGDRPSVGWLMRNRPAQSLHKIMNGVPASEMLSLQFMADRQIADLLAYLAILDKQKQ